MDRGLERIAKQIDWLKPNISSLREKHGDDFPDNAQYEVFARFNCEKEWSIGNYLMKEGECYAWVSQTLDEKNNG